MKMTRDERAVNPKNKKSYRDMKRLRKAHRSKGKTKQAEEFNKAKENNKKTKWKETETGGDEGDEDMREQMKKIDKKVEEQQTIAAVTTERETKRRKKNKYKEWKGAMAYIMIAGKRV